MLNITVIHGQSHKGSTYNITKGFVEQESLFNNEKTGSLSVPRYSDLELALVYLRMIEGTLNSVEAIDKNDELQFILSVKNNLTMHNEYQAQYSRK